MNQHKSSKSSPPLSFLAQAGRLRDENDKAFTPFGYKPRISQRFIGDSSIHRTITQPYPLSLDGRGIKGEGENDASSTVILDLIQNPQGGEMPR